MYNVSVIINGDSVLGWWCAIGRLTVLAVTTSRKCDGERRSNQQSRLVAKQYDQICILNTLI